MVGRLTISGRMRTVDLSVCIARDPISKQDAIRVILQTKVVNFTCSGQKFVLGSRHRPIHYNPSDSIFHFVIVNIITLTSLPERPRFR